MSRRKILASLLSYIGSIGVFSVFFSKKAFASSGKTYRYGRIVFPAGKTLEDYKADRERFANLDAIKKIERYLQNAGRMRVNYINLRETHVELEHEFASYADFQVWHSEQVSSGHAKMQELYRLGYRHEVV